MSATTRTCIGLDLGGTHLRGAVVCGDHVGALHKRVAGDVRDAKSVLQMLADLIQEIRVSAGDVEIAGIGLGVPALIDHARGVVITAPHYPAWKNFPLVERLQTLTQLNVAIDNDANCIALGEQHAGAARALDSWCMLTLGTGIGGGIVFNRQLHRGPHGFAGEVGHITIDARAPHSDPNRGAPRCPCGGAGHFENFASASGMENCIALLDPADQVALREHASLTTHDESACNVGAPNHARHTFAAGNVAQLASLADENHPPAQRLWMRFGEYLGCGIASLVNVLGMTDFVIGGGLSGAWEHFIESTHASICARLYPELAPRVRLHRATLGDRAGILGAAQLVTHHCAAALHMHTTDKA